MLAAAWCRQQQNNRYKEDGVAAFYRGLAASVLLCVNPAIYNTVFDQLKARLLARIEARSGGRRVVALSTVQAFVLGVIAKAIATLLTYPYIRAKMVMQAASRAKRSNNLSSTTSAGAGGNASAAGEDAGCQCGAGSCSCGDDDEADVPEVRVRMASCAGVLVLGGQHKRARTPDYPSSLAPPAPSLLSGLTQVRGCVRV